MSTRSPSNKRSPKRAATLPAGSVVGKLVRIGNSRGIRLPKSVIEQAGLGSEVEIRVNGRQVVIESPETTDPRAGWEEQIRKELAAHGDDIDEWRDWQSIANEFDEKEWTW